MARSVVAPDGVRWKVGRRWAPARVRLRRRRRDGDGLDVGDLGFDVFDGPLAIIGVLAAAVVLFLVVWPIVAIALELVLLVLIFLISLAGRVLFRRPWTVLARSTTPGTAREYEWRVAGWRRSARLIDAAAEALAGGLDLPAGAGSGGLAEHAK